MASRHGSVPSENVALRWRVSLVAAGSQRWQPRRRTVETQIANWIPLHCIARFNIRSCIRHAWDGTHPFRLETSSTTEYSASERERG